MKHIILFSIACLLLSTLVSAQADKFILADHLPERTVGLLSFPDRLNACEEWKNSSLGKIFHEPEMQQFLKPFHETYKNEIDSALGIIEKQLGLSARELLDVFTGEISLAIVDLDFRSRMPFDALFAIHYGEKEEQINLLLRLMEKEARSKFEKNESGIYTSKRAPICYTKIGGTLVFSTNPQVLQEVMTNAGKTPGKLLKDDTKFQLALSKVQGEKTPLALLYVNTERLFTALPIPERDKAPMEALGLFEIKAVSKGVNFSNGHINANFFIQTGEKKGVLEVLNFPAIDMAVAEKVPSHSMIFSISNIDMEKMVKDIENVLGVDPSGQLKEAYNQGSQALAEMLGFSLQDDLVKTIGGPMYSFSYMPAEGGLLPRSISVLPLKDVEKFKNSMGRVLNILNLGVKNDKMGDTSYQYIVSDMGKLGDNPFDDINKMRDPIEAMAKSFGYGNSGIAFMFEDNNLYIAANGQDMRSFLSERSQWTQNITQNPDFKKLRSDIPADSSVVVYVDTRPLFNGLWNTLVPVARAFEGWIRAAGVPLETALLPRVQTVSQHLKPACISYASNKDGILISTNTVAGGGLPFVFLGGVAAAIIPQIQQMKMKANEASAMATLKTIATSQEMYRVDTTGYGHLQELLGLTAKNDGIDGVRKKYMSLEAKPNNKGIFTINGYNFYCYVSKEEEDEDVEVEAVGEFHDCAILDNSKRYVVYAWPEKPGKTCRRTFVINQAGKIYTTYAYYYSKPKAAAAFAKDAKNSKNIEGKFPMYRQSVDGNYWYPTR